MVAGDRGDSTRGVGADWLVENVGIQVPAPRAAGAVPPGSPADWLPLPCPHGTFRPTRYPIWDAIAKKMMPEELARKAHMHAHQHKSHRQEHFSLRIQPFTILSASSTS
jgi:hypothetical protein